MKEKGNSEHLPPGIIEKGWSPSPSIFGPLWLLGPSVWLYLVWRYCPLHHPNTVYGRLQQLHSLIAFFNAPAIVRGTGSGSVCVNLFLCLFNCSFEYMISLKFQSQMMKNQSTLLFIEPSTNQNASLRSYNFRPIRLQHSSHVTFDQSDCSIYVSCLSTKLCEYQFNDR